jgi:hypothetical protein
MRLVHVHGGCLQNPCGRDDLAAAPVAVMRQQEPKASVIAQYGVEAAVRGFLARVVNEPRRVGLGADRLPDLLLQVLGTDRPIARASTSPSTWVSTEA